MFKDNQNISNTDNMSDFVSLVKTKYDQEILLGEIDLILASLYLTNGGALQETLDKKIRAEVSSLVKEAKLKEKNFQGFLKSLRQILIELKEVDLTIAIDPTEEIVNQTYNWLKTYLNQSLVINFNKNPDLVGGAQIAYKGKYFEFSLKKELAEVLKGKQANL